MVFKAIIQNETTKEWVQMEKKQRAGPWNSPLLSDQDEEENPAKKTENEQQGKQEENQDVYARSQVN